MGSTNTFTQRVANSYWIDNTTFLIEFEEKQTTDKPLNEGDTEVVCIEFQKDENKWVLYKQYYDKDNDFIQHASDCFTPYERGMYMTMAQDEYKRANCGDAWEQIIVANNYEKYDALIDSIKEYYGKGENNYEVEDICNKYFIDLLRELDMRFK